MADSTIISSFNEDGDIVKGDDASILLAFSHISYDAEIVKTIPFEFVNHTCQQLVNFFREKYNDPNMYCLLYGEETRHRNDILLHTIIFPGYLLMVF